MRFSTKHNPKGAKVILMPSNQLPRQNMQASLSDLSVNPLLQDWVLHQGLPPFNQINAEDFEPAFDVALSRNWAEIEAIASNPAEPNFDNTLAAFDASGRLLNRVGHLFHNLTASETSPALQALELRMSPRLAAHDNAIYMNAALFAKIDALHSQRDVLPLDGEQMRLLERVHLEFVRAGARLKEEQRLRYGQIVTELASLYTRRLQVPSATVWLVDRS
jgi:peptidyl-dipeptidase Dcp